MPSHDWSDHSFDWKGLNSAIDMIDTFMTRWGRIGVSSKEKYGTARIAVSFWDGSLHGLLYPGYYSCQFPKWLWSLDLFFIFGVFRNSFLVSLINWYQSKIYSVAYKRALKKFPHIKAEIVTAADFPQYIKEYDDIMNKWHFMAFLRAVITLKDF